MVCVQNPARLTAFATEIQTASSSNRLESGVGRARFEAGFFVAMIPIPVNVETDDSDRAGAARRLQRIDNSDGAAGAQMLLPACARSSRRDNGALTIAQGARCIVQLR